MATASRLLALARPKGAILIASLPVAGFGYGLWERGSTLHPYVVLPTIGVLLATWVLGHAGAMWLNAVLDHDEGEVLLGRSVPVPRHTGLAGYVALALSVSTSLLIGGITTVCAASCAMMAILYSHERTALKGRAFAGPLVNGFGYGSLSPIAGFAAAATVPTWRALTCLGFAVLFILGVYFAAQAFQQEEDRRRGYRTLVATHGPRLTLLIARICLAATAIGATMFAVVGAHPRAGLVAVPLWVWMDRHLAAWSRKHDGGEEADATRLVAIVTLAGVTMIAGAYAHQIWALHNGEATGGCGTAIVPAVLAGVCN